MNKPVINCMNISKRFRKQVVLDGLNLEIHQGEIFVLLGSSGAGKSVLLKHILGLLRPDSGSVEVFGQEVSSMKEELLLPFRSRVGMVFQHSALFQSLNVFENIAFPLRELGLCANERELKSLVLENMEKLELGGFSEKKVAELSGGMKKRVAIARSLCLKSEIVLYDEPTAGLDPILSGQVDEIIRIVNRKLKKTTVVVTHDLSSAMYLADRIGVMKAGKLIFNGSPDELMKEEHPYILQFLERARRDRIE